MTNKQMKKEKMQGMLKKIIKAILTVLATMLCTVGALLCFSISWMFRTWNNLSMDELMYHLTAPLDGTNQSMLSDYLQECVVGTVFILFSCIILYIQFRKNKKLYYGFMSISVCFAIIVSSFFLSRVWNELGVSEYTSNQGTYSDFFDSNYVDPRDVKITFPQQKRNLIYIFLESMEYTYADEASGGGFRENCIPELTELAQENEDFSGEDAKLNGALPMPGTTWTVAGMFGQGSGIPLSVSIDGNSMDMQDSFFSDAVTIGDVLEQAGYNQTLLIGSDATFGGRRLLYTEHGNYGIKDYNYAIENGWIPEDYNVWWGYEDEKLFDNAKEELQDLSSQSEPFNLTMLTVDTHFEDGYVCELCDDEFGNNQYANVMACSSRQVAEFVKWVQQQDFYENTSIVISGDHLTMDSDFCNDITSECVRKVYTSYINAAADVQSSARRDYTTFDAYPTTLASMGVQIEGNRLGLGTNLFSSEPTLTERYGVNKMKEELSKKSKKIEELASIDEDKAITFDTDSSQNTAVLETGEYDYETGILPIYMWNVDGIGVEVESVIMAAWHDEDQSDLTWIEAEKQGDGNYLGAVNVPNFDYKTGEYYIDVYVVDGDGAQHLIGTTTGIVSD